MKKIGLVVFLIVQLICSNLSASAVDVSSKVCNATIKVCVSNVTNPLTVKDDALLQACEACCAAPNLLGIKGCGSRCKKQCNTAYKKEVKKKNPKM